MIHIPCTDYHLFSGNVEQQLWERYHSVFRKRVGRRHHICGKQNNQNYSHVKNITCGRRVYLILSATVFYTFRPILFRFFYIFINLFCLYIFFCTEYVIPPPGIDVVLPWYYCYSVSIFIIHIIIIFFCCWRTSNDHMDAFEKVREKVI